MSVSLFVITILAFFSVSGCGKSGGGSTGGTTPISVSASASSTTVDPADPVTLTAAVVNDSSNAGVTWATPSAGTLSSTTSASPIYTAPAGVTSSAQSVTLTATSVADKTKSGSIILTIPAAATITTTSLPSFTAGATYSAQLAGSGGIAPYAWAVIGGTLPTGVSLNETTGVISAAAGATTATTQPAYLIFQLTDSGRPTPLTSTVTLSLTINAPSITGNVWYDNGIPTPTPAPAVSTREAVLFHSAAASSYASIFRSAVLTSIHATDLIESAASSSNSSNSEPPVTVSINTNPVQSTTTDSNGNFSFASVPNGTYTITPSLAGTNAIFTPATQSVTISNNVSQQVSFKADVGYSISGTVAYTGTATGPIYLVAKGAGGALQGTSITAPGSFTINGVEPGNYTIVAWKDALGNGAPNALDPAGSATADIGAAGNVTGVSVALTDPAPVAFNSALNPTVTATPFDQGVVLSAQSLLDIFDTSSVFTNDLGLTAEVATSYKVQWCADSACATVIGSQIYPATVGQGTNTWFLNGLSDAKSYYFRYQGLAGSATSSWSPAVGPVTPGQPSIAGAVAVSGAVTLPDTATGPLYISFQNQATSAYYYTCIPNPVSPQSYSIQLPAGIYDYSAFVDQNKNSVELNGDMETASNLPALTVTDIPATQNMTLVNGGESYVTWTTNNAQTVSGSSSSTQQYSIQFQAIDGTKHLIAAELKSGPNAITVQDIPRSFENPGYSFDSTINLFNTPSIGDSYSLLLTYSDGSQQTLTEKVTGVVGNFGANPSPAGVGTDLNPTFTWTNPAIADSFPYNYFLLYPISLPSGGIYFYRGIYLTPPDTTGCGLIKVANGTGPTCTACWANR
ncbi:MAG: carboxypeptidase regulatory-like domain-containing protein [Terracidiphilus sp.]